MQPLQHHHQPSRHRCALPPYEPLRRESRTDARCVRLRENFIVASLEPRSTAHDLHSIDEPEFTMTVLSDYARYSFEKTKQLETLLAEIKEPTASPDERIWKYNMAVQIVRELNERGNREVPGQAFSSE